MALSDGVSASLRMQPSNRNSDFRAGTMFRRRWRSGGESFIPPVSRDNARLALRPGCLAFKEIPSLIDGRRVMPRGQISMSSSAKSDVTLDQPPTDQRQHPKQLMKTRHGALEPMQNRGYGSPKRKG